MRAAFAAESLRCPACRRDRTLTLVAAAADEREIREGVLHCRACGAEHPVHRGVGELMRAAPEHVTREAEGLRRFADQMHADGWTRESVRRLPDIQDGYWYVQSTSFHQLLSTIGFMPGQRLLDIGSNTCWATNRFAVHGLEVVALDISLWELQGLWTADYFIEDGTSYFERVLGSMNDMPLASASLDYVYACEVLHHNDVAGLRRTFQEAFRVLRPGGRMLVINETLKTMRDPVGVHLDGVAQFDGHEHAHWAARYRLEAIRAGFATRLLEPLYHPFYREPPATSRPRWTNWRLRAYEELRARPLGRRAYLPYLNHVKGGASFGMVATKPDRAARRLGRR